MLNYIWGGLIIISLVFAIASDGYDHFNDTYRNGEKIPVNLTFPESSDKDTRQPVTFSIGSDDTVHQARWFPTDSGTELIISVTDDLPEHWQLVAQDQDARDLTTLRAEVVSFDASAGTAQIVLPAVILVKMRAITQAAFDMAEFAVTLAIGLIGIMALWLGLMKIAEECGLIYKLVKVVNPVLGKLFPNVPKDHPALGAISLNLSANMLGLGNAATPLGIKAMEELQKLNPDKESATNAMCMFLTMNTASVQLVPPVTLIALLGVGVAELFYSIIIATAISLTVGILAAKYYAAKFPEQPIEELTEIKEA
jgi:spore maturation protein A